MQKRDFETCQKRFPDFEILSKFSENHVFRGIIRHPYKINSVFSTFSFVMFDSYENLFGRNDHEARFLLTVITSSYFYFLFRQNM